MGYMPRRGINRIGQRLGYIWFPKTTSFIQSHGFTNRMEWIWNTDFGALETFTNRLNWEIHLRSGATAGADFKVTQENLSSPFFIGEVKIDEGKYRFQSLDLTYHSPSGLPFQLGAGASGGGYYGGWQAGGVLAPSLTLSAKLTLLMEYNFNRAKVRNGVYQVHLARL